MKNRRWNSGDIWILQTNSNVGHEYNGIRPGVIVQANNIPCKEGDEVVIFGEGNELHEYASAMGTIVYEALTSVSERVKRIYIQRGS